MHSYSLEEVGQTQHSRPQSNGDIVTRADVAEMATFLSDEDAEVKDEIAKGMSTDDAVKTLTFPEYEDYRDYRVREHDIRSLYNDWEVQPYQDWEVQLLRLDAHRMS